jgi:cytochrome P450
LFLELGRHKQVLEKLINEIDSVIGTKSEISIEDLHDLKYTGGCIKEALRLWPPAPQLTRRCTKTIQTQNFAIPPGARLAVNLMF